MTIDPFQPPMSKVINIPRGLQFKTFIKILASLEQYRRKEES